MFKYHCQFFLKVKIKALATESKMIRQTERKCTDSSLRGWLHYHRTVDVRLETRGALIAYAYMRGKTLESIEGRSVQKINPNNAYIRAYNTIKKFGTTTACAGFDDWLRSKCGSKLSEVK